MLEMILMCSTVLENPEAGLTTKEHVIYGKVAYQIGGNKKGSSNKDVEIIIWLNKKHWTFIPSTRINPNGSNSYILQKKKEEKTIKILEELMDEFIIMVEKTLLRWL